jgi:hypothetical protein
LLPVEANESDSSCDNLVAYRWKSLDSYRLVVANLSRATSQGRIHVEQELRSSSSYIFSDRFNDQKYVRERSDLVSGGLYVRLGAYGCHIFDVSATKSATA